MASEEGTRQHTVHLAESVADAALRNLLRLLEAKARAVQRQEQG
jgi:hypothetical protein